MFEYSIDFWKTNDSFPLILILFLQKQKPEVSEDPARRYFNAFPALSDQSQTDYSHKKASWPHVSNTDSSSSSSSNINSFGSNQPSNVYPSSSTGCGSASASGSSASGSGATAIATKKKTKRRRVTNSLTMASNWSNTNQLDAKSSAQPPMQMQMQSSKVTSSSGSGAISSTTRLARNANQTKTNQRKKPSDMWDTDFDGAWEMGRDLIREFVLKQNNQRNRSVSECDTTVAGALVASSSSSSSTALQSPMKGVMIESAMDLPSHRKDGIEKRKCTNDEDEENLMRVAAAATSALFGKNFDMNLYAPFNLCESETVSSITDSSGQLLMVNDKVMQRSEGYSTPDTLASWNEIETAVTPRRDYESMQYATMDGSNAKLGYQIAVDSGSDCVDSGCDEMNAFEAKFDHNVEALWNDCKSIDDPKSGSGTMTMMMDGQHSFWFDYDKQITNQNTTANVDQFKQFFQTNPSAINSYAMHGGFGGAELNRGGFATVTAAAAKLAAVASSQANGSLINANTSSSSSTAVPPMPSIGGMNLTSTIWTDTPNNNEDDVSFYANARLWEMNQSKSMGRKLNVSSINHF